MLPLAAVACLGVALASLVVPAAPGYDAWSWLLWGREITRLDLSTAEGPAFKPLPVAVTTALAPLGGAAPDAWLVVARTGAAAAVVLAFVAARDLAAGSRLAGVAAAAGVALTSGFVMRAANGDSEPLLLALVLGAFLRARAGRHGQALALGAAAGLVRVEAWPFLLAYGAWCAWRHPSLRVAIAAGAVLVPAAWFVPEYLGSGQLLRSSDRALVPNPGAPALAEVPALESLRRAAGLLFVPAVLGVVAAVVLRAGRAALLPAAAGLAWLLLVALMAEAGFSGEERYALPGAAVLAVTGGVGLALAARRRGPAVAVAAVALVAVFGALRAGDVAAQGDRLRRGDALARLLPRVIELAGGRARLLACGRPAVGRYRGPLLAWHLDVEKRRVRADGGAAAVAFRSRLASEPVSPASPAGAQTLAANARWRVEARCAGPSGGSARRPAPGPPPR